jgi:diacylglycerol kinase
MQVLKSFGHAWEGIKHASREHPNFKIHLLIALLALFFAIVLKFSRIEYIVLLIIILVVVMAELVNTAVEEITNLITVKWDKHAKIAKDVSAGMVLISAIGAIVVGLILFIPKLFS